jgi:selenocysteine-specific elongation factor
MRVFGTAGHVDHGKSTLVKRLTGIDPDRLAEEKARQMTIDLGFAWLALPNGEMLGLVDVPGHRDFIENMLAGVGGIDAVLLIIAADEGIMPQTREHLAILDLLGIQHGLIVLTKIDMIDDPDWIGLIEADVRSVVAGTTLADAPILPVSARTGAGIDILLAHTHQLAADFPPRKGQQSPRLPIDRVFSISGFGTVVTGTLLGGTMSVGDAVELQPSGLEARVRALHSYNQPVETAQPGSRVAVNLAGLDKDQVRRGEVVTQPGTLQPTLLVDVQFRHLPDTGRPLQHNAEVKVFTGTAESVGHVRLLADEFLAPGAESWLQIRLETPLVLAQGDRFILRYPSPPQTIGGGVIVNPHPAGRWRRFQEAVIADLETRAQGTPAERLAQAADQPEPVRWEALQSMLGLPPDESRSALAAALESGWVLKFPDGLIWSVGRVQTLLDRLLQELTAFHQATPLRPGMPREELRGRLGLSSLAFNLLLSTSDQVGVQGSIARLASHQVTFTPRQQAQIAALNTQMAAAPYTPPSLAQVQEIVGEKVLYALLELGDLVQVNEDVIFGGAVYAEMVEAVLSIIDAQGNVTAANLRDRFNTTRKYAIGLLEHLDALGVTKRVGDTRVRGHRSL